MTNKEYIEKTNISFSDAMKMWDNKTSCINDWLNQEYQKHKFKVGDFIRKVIDDGHEDPNSYIGVVTAISQTHVHFKQLYRNGQTDECYMANENTFEKIF